MASVIASPDGARIHVPALGRDLPVLMEVPDAGALGGFSRYASYRAAREGAPPTLRIGQRLRCPPPPCWTSWAWPTRRSSRDRARPVRDDEATARREHARFMAGTSHRQIPPTPTDDRSLAVAIRYADTHPSARSFAIKGAARLSRIDRLPDWPEVTGVPVNVNRVAARITARSVSVGGTAGLAPTVAGTWFVVLSRHRLRVPSNRRLHGGVDRQRPTGAGPGTRSRRRTARRLTAPGPSVDPPMRRAAGPL